MDRNAKKIVRTVTVIPRIPEALERLRSLSHNLWLFWNQDALDLFRRIDMDLWESTGHNPVDLLGKVSQERINQLAADEGFLDHLERTWAQFQQYVKSSARFPEHNVKSPTIAYFSFEFGLTEAIPVYSGGLGVLSGDHLKSASDLGLPLVAVGLMYRDGYFKQYLNPDGWQQETDPSVDFYNLPANIEMDKNGRPILIQVAYPEETVKAQMWRINVGRITLILLDTNITSNSPGAKEITAKLYGGDKDMRIRQEILLGLGGIAALDALSIEPKVCHMNEGHAAFLGLERIRRMMAAEHCSFAVAREAVAAGNVFTTHTPVPAGNDVFPSDLMDIYFRSYFPQLGLDRKEFLGLGRQNPRDENEAFCMTVLALKLSGRSNGVSKLHGQVSRAMWQNVWPDVPMEEIPITSITNGVHIPSWISWDLAGLYNRYVGIEWVRATHEADMWKKVVNIPGEELWRTHERRRERLVAVTRKWLRDQLQHRSASRSELDQSSEVLDPNALTIGFARRFATYKRATLLFRNPARLSAILNDRERPVQIIFAGKAHPRDNEGKELIRQIIHMARRDEFRRRIVFVEDYNINIARYLVQGCDVWLNTPLRPMEASGTSGMKASVNGVLNFSIPDGWWCEGYNGDNGWNIGNGEQYASREEQDNVESSAIYDLLEKEIVPSFYERGRDRIPRDWIRRMKNALMTLSPAFNTGRMVSEYASKFYFPAMAQYGTMTAENLLVAREVAEWKEGITKKWPAVRIEKIEPDELGEVIVGEVREIAVRVNLGDISPSDVLVEVCYGPVDSLGSIIRTKIVPLEAAGPASGKTSTFSARLNFFTSGRQGLAFRILPKHKHMISKFDTNLIAWA